MSRDLITVPNALCPFCGKEKCKCALDIYLKYLSPFTGPAMPRERSISAAIQTLDAAGYKVLKVDEPAISAATQILEAAKFDSDCGCGFGRGCPRVHNEEAK